MGINQSVCIEAEDDTPATPPPPPPPPPRPSDDSQATWLRKSLTKYGFGQVCSRGCGRPAYGKFETCCTRCDGAGRHSVDCGTKGLCAEGCGRRANVGGEGKVFKTCCKSCSHLRGTVGVCGHDALCDVRDNGGRCPPWYWKSAASWCREDGEQFHEEVGGDYVKRMGTRLLQRSMPGHAVLRCERVEDSLLWEKYTAKRAEIRKRAVAIEDVRPETSECIGFSAASTLDSHVNEVWLFHGTDEMAARAIAKSNFRMPRHAGNFGKGAYFAEAAKKSDAYSKAVQVGELAGCKIMLLCRVTLGSIKWVEGRDSKAERLAQDPHVDSVLGKTDFREFLVYDVAQIYPEYIMWYRQGPYDGS